MNKILCRVLQRRGIDLSTVDESTDLLQGGLVDSLGFIEVVAELEAELGASLNFESLGPDFSLIGALGRVLSEAEGI